VRIEGGLVKRFIQGKILISVSFGKRSWIHPTSSHFSLDGVRGLERDGDKSRMDVRFESR